MKKPSKKPKIIEREASRYYLNVDKTYSPDDLRKIASLMEVEKVFHIRTYLEGYDGYFSLYESIMETPEEAEKRYNKEMKEYEIYCKREENKKEKRIKALIAEAKKLGLKVEKE